MAPDRGGHFGLDRQVALKSDASWHAGNGGQRAAWLGCLARLGHITRMGGWRLCAERREAQCHGTEQSQAGAAKAERCYRGRTHDKTLQSPTRIGRDKGRTWNPPIHETRDPVVIFR